MPTNDPRLSLILLAGLILLGVLALFALLPLVGRLSMLIEAWTLLSEPIGDLVGNRNVATLGCLVILLVVVGCCIIAVIGGAALFTCGSPNPSQLCHMLGR